MSVKAEILIQRRYTHPMTEADSTDFLYLSVREFH